MAEAVKKSEGSDVRQVTPIRKSASELATTRALSPFAEFERLFDDFLPRRFLSPFRWDLTSLPTADLEAKIPRVDVIERDKEIVVRAELPGIDKDKVDISLTDDSVTIKTTTQHEEKEEKGDYYRCEISRGAYSRTVALPRAINTELAKATFKNGVLELVLPKAEETKRRTIKVE